MPSPLRLSALAFLLHSVTVFAQTNITPQLEPPKPNEAKPRQLHPSVLPIEDVAGLPRVMIVGDSISMGYTIPVREALAGKANVHRVPSNGGPTERGVQYLDRWLGKEHWDVIYFNFGLHDLKWQDAEGKYVPPGTGSQVAPLPVYEKNLRTIVQKLKATKAKVIFATTTPVPDGAIGRSDVDRKKYNEVAVKIMNEEGVEVSDLAAFAEGIQSKFPPYPPYDPAKTRPTIHPGSIQPPYDVHYTPEGYTLMAQKVIAPTIEKSLPPKSN